MCSNNPTLSAGGLILPFFSFAMDLPSSLLDAAIGLGQCGTKRAFL